MKRNEMKWRADILAKDEPACYPQDLKLNYYKCVWFSVVEKQQQQQKHIQQTKDIIQTY